MNKEKSLLKFYKKNWKQIIIVPIIASLCVFIMGKYIDFQNIDLQNIVLKIKNHYLEVYLLVTLIIILFRKTIKRYISYCILSKLNNIDLIISEISLLAIILFAKYKRKELLFILGGIITIKIIRYIILLIKKKKNKYNTVWLHQVYNNDFKCKEKNNIFIREEASNVDLLNKQYEIDEIRKIIVQCKPENAFFIGLDAKWSKGKTTIINLVKKSIHKDKEAKDIIIVDFDPCMYSDCESMLSGFYNTIAEKLGIGETLRFKQALQKLIENVSASSVTRANIGIKFSNFFSKIDVNNIICNELENTNKRLLIIVDNLDRADLEIMNFFVRCTYTVTKFKHTIFLLLYDGDLLNTQLSKFYNTNNLFMNKIINLPIKMAETDSTRINEIFNTAVKNLINKGYIEGFSHNEIENIDFYDDLREVIRVLNYMMYNSKILNKLKLNYYDFLALLYIKEHDFALYEEIFNNRECLTYKSPYINNSNNSSYSQEVINKLKKLYNSAKDEKCKKILKKLFENINNIVNFNYISFCNYGEKRR